MNDQTLAKIYDRETLEKIRVTLTVQLTRLRGDEQTADDDSYEAVQDFIKALEFCLEDITRRLKMIEMLDKWIDDNMPAPIIGRLGSNDAVIGPDIPN